MPRSRITYLTRKATVYLFSILSCFSSNSASISSIVGKLDLISSGRRRLNWYSEIPRGWAAFFRAYSATTLSLVLQMSRPMVRIQAAPAVTARISRFSVRPQQSNAVSNDRRANPGKTLLPRPECEPVFRHMRILFQAPAETS